MHIKVLGPGCNNCITLHKLAQEVVNELGIEATFEKIEDYSEIMAHGIMSTPGLVVDDVVVLSGRVPTKSALKEIIKSL